MANVRLKRLSRLCYAARKVSVWVDGVLQREVSNGAECDIFIQCGKHEISFFVGRKVFADIVIDVQENTERFDVIFWFTNSGELEVKATNYNVVVTINRRKVFSVWPLILICIVFLFFLFGFKIFPVIYLFPAK